MSIDPDFFTPPRIEPLNLDLAYLEGGGFAPSQFYGETHDGRRVYCRYRGGTLSIDIGNAAGVDPSDDGRRILQAVIGPGMHGSISWEQICLYAGVSIDGWCPSSFPSASEIDQEGFLDLSGETTFLEMDAYSTEETALWIYDEIGRRVPDITGAQRLEASPRRYAICRTSAEASTLVLEFLRPTPTSPVRLGEWPKQVFGVEGIGQCVLFGKIGHAAYKPPFQPLRFGSVPGLTKATVPVRQSIGPDEPPFARLWIKLSFPTTDEAGRQLARAVHQIFEEYYPPRKSVAFNLGINEYLPNWPSLGSQNVDRKIVELLNGGGNR